MTTCGFMVRFSVTSSWILSVILNLSAYQSALVTTPLVLLRIFGSLVGLPSFLNTLVTLWIIITQGFMAYVILLMGETSALIQHTLFTGSGHILMLHRTI